MWSTLTLFRVGLIAVPLLYGLYIYSDYRSQVNTISRQKQEIERLTKENHAWEGRYARINTKREDYKEHLKTINEAIQTAGCEAAVDKAIKNIKNRNLVREVFGGHAI